MALCGWRLTPFTCLLSGLPLKPDALRWSHVVRSWMFIFLFSSPCHVRHILEVLSPCIEHKAIREGQIFSLLSFCCICKLRVKPIWVTILCDLYERNASIDHLLASLPYPMWTRMKKKENRPNNRKKEQRRYRNGKGTEGKEIPMGRKQMKGEKE